jgi:hypothetical protein
MRSINSNGKVFVAGIALPFIGILIIQASVIVARFVQIIAVRANSAFVAACCHVNFCVNHGLASSIAATAACAKATQPGALQVLGGHW